MAIERSFYKILDGMITKMREIIPEEIKILTYIPLTEDQELNVLENSIMITLVSAQIGAQCSGESVKRRYTLRISAKYNSLKSHKAAIAWAFSVLENICMYLIIQGNPVATYLEANGLTYVEPGEIVVENAPNGTTAEAEFYLDLIGDATIKYGTDLTTIYKSLYDEINGLCDTYTIVEGD